MIEDEIRALEQRLGNLDVQSAFTDESLGLRIAECERRWGLNDW
jgi:hypothetical protein